MTNLTNETTLGGSSALPTTYDAEAITGYPSLTFTAIGKVVDVSGIEKIYNIVSQQYVGELYPEKLKGTYDIGNVTITLGRAIADAGQLLLQAALGADTSYAFEVVLGSGNTANFTGKVVKAATGGIAADGVETTSVEIAVDPQSLFEA